jgi:hypothetical protein
MMMMPGATLTLPERRVASDDMKETQRLIRRGNVQTVQHLRNKQVLMETLLGKLQTGTKHPMLNGRSVLIPNHLVPGCMRNDCHTKVEGSETLVYVGTGTE